MPEPLFLSLDFAGMAEKIRGAEVSVCYAAPGIHREPANAMVEVARQIGPELITVCVDFDERVLRMGFGDLAAVNSLRDAGIVVSSAPCSSGTPMVLPVPMSHTCAVLFVWAMTRRRLLGLKATR